MATQLRAEVEDLLRFSIAWNDPSAQAKAAPFELRIDDVEFGRIDFGEIDRCSTVGVLERDARVCQLLELALARDGDPVNERPLDAEHDLDGVRLSSASARSRAEAPVSFPESPKIRCRSLKRYSSDLFLPLLPRIAATVTKSVSREIAIGCLSVGGLVCATTDRNRNARVGMRGQRCRAPPNY